MVSWNKRLSGKKAGSINKNGYRTISVFGKVYYAHRLAFAFLNNRWPKKEIDHINLNRADNRRENLRRTSQTENQLRAKGGGVRWHKQMKKWQVRLTYRYQEIHVGYFDEEELARHVALIARDQLLRMIASTEILTPSQVKSYFSKRKQS